MPARWLTRCSADVPPGDDWLSPRERAVQAGFKIAKRRDDWRLGRWTAKALLGPGAEVVAAADGAPEAFIDGRPAGVTLSISHRAGLALAVVADGPVGCDLEVVEPRSSAFIADWLSPDEQAWAAADPLRVNLLWTAKEAVAKLRREGLRLDVRDAVVRVGDPDGDWHPLEVDWDGVRTAGRWRRQGDWVMTVAGG